MRDFRHTLALVFAFALLPVLLVGCDSAGSAQEQLQLSDVDVDGILQQETDGVILATYQDLASKAGTLEERVKALESDRTASNLEAAQQAWVDARAPWEASESFLFGPVATAGLDPALDSWPVDETAIQDIIGGTRDVSDKSVVEGFDDTAHGFHTIEFFLFGPEGNRSASELSDREYTYLVTATEVLHDDAEELTTSWASGAGFRSDFLAGSGQYSSKKASLEQLAEGMNIIANEVGSGKIGTPLNEQSIKSIESKYSQNSFRDYRNNMVSIRRIYSGDAFGASGAGLDDIVREANPAAHDSLQAQIDDAISMLETLDENTSFRQAVENGETGPVEDVQQRILDIRETIRTEIKPAISGL